MEAFLCRVFAHTASEVNVQASHLSLEVVKLSGSVSILLDFENYSNSGKCNFGLNKLYLIVLHFIRLTVYHYADSV